MRQSMLDFGQRPPVAPKSTAAPQARAAQGTPAGGSSSTTASSSSSNRHVAPSSFFAKRERKEEVESVNTASIVEQDDPRPPQKRKVELPKAPLRRQRSAFPDAPWPGRDDIHVQPDAASRASAIASTSSLNLPRQSKEQEASDKSPETIWPWPRDDGSGDSTAVDSSRRLGDKAGMVVLPKETSTSSSARHAALWTDRWKPRSANDVLGNNRQALYMRDWLHALQVTGVPGYRGSVMNGARRADALQQPRQITKRVQKRRGRPTQPKEMDDFIIGDDEEEEAWFDQFRRAGSPPSIEEGAGTSIEADMNDDNLDFAHAAQLSNVILLVGPSGCGKTAAVFACAHELGFEVFELYPGMGKRSGKEVTSAVGDVGRNHMVTSGGTGGGAFQKASSSKLDAFFKPPSAPSAQTGSAPGNTSKPRQSLILFEEVDVLYEDDKGFWPALIELVSDSRRPIVLTCNDLSTVPLCDLPLQCVLQFAAPSTGMAAAYLQIVAAKEGHSLPLDFAADTFCNHAAAEENLRRDENLVLSDNGPLHPGLSANLLGARLDLRQALMQLQFACQRPDSTDDCTPAPHEAHTSTKLRTCITAAEARSCAAALQVRSHGCLVEELEEDNCQATPDDVQVSSSWLRKPLLKGDEVALPLVGREEVFQSAVCEAARTRLGTMQEAAAYHRARLDCSRAIDQVTANLSIAYQSRVPSHEAVLDYAALIAKMVEVDDAEEAAHDARVLLQLDEARQMQNRAGGYTAAAWSEASASLAQLGIRSSRQSSRLLLQRDNDGKLQLGVRESAFSRWLLLDEASLALARSFCLRWADGA